MPQKDLRQVGLKISFRIHLEGRTGDKATACHNQEQNLNQELMWEAAD